MYRNGQKQIEKGDKFSSIAIYHDDELVAFKQIGAGGDSKNVILATKGDVDMALKNISAMDLVDNKNITYEELKDIQEQINDKPGIKINK